MSCDVSFRADDSGQLYTTYTCSGIDRCTVEAMVASLWEMGREVEPEVDNPMVLRCPFQAHSVNRLASMRRLAAAFPGVACTDAPSALYDLLGLEATAVDASTLQGIDVYPKLRPYQRVVLSALLARRGRAINMSEMGTGKTAVSIGFVEYYGARDVLIICPSSTRQNMVNEIQRFTRHIPTLVSAAKTPLNLDGINVISFDLLTKCPTDRKWNTIVVDESHYIKNRQSKRSIAVLKLCKKAQHVLLMTGTPTSKPLDLFPQLKALHPQTFSAFTSLFRHNHVPTTSGFHFGDRYCDPQKTFIRPGHFEYTYTGAKRMNELHAILSFVGERRRKADVLHLPTKTRQVHEVGQLDPTESAAQMRKVALLREKKGLDRANHAIGKLVREHSVFKLPFVLEHVETLLTRAPPAEGGSKYIFFAHHRPMLHALRAACGKYGKKCIYIDGTTPTVRRQALIDEFNTSPQVCFAVLSINACGVGLNITGASNVVFAELLWCDKMILQAEDRVHRSGQEKPVVIEYLITRHSIDEVMMKKIQRKNTQSSLTVDNELPPPYITI